jgi:hypothetical protein
MFRVCLYTVTQHIGIKNTKIDIGGLQAAELCLMRSTTVI